MIQIVRLMTLMAIVLLGSSLPSLAEESKKDTSLHLGEVEITAKLRDIIDAFELKQTEIVGSLDGPGYEYQKPWDNPDPFMEEDEAVDLTRQMINQSFVPLDHNVFSQQIAIINGLEPTSQNRGVQIRPIVRQNIGTGNSTFSQLVPAE